jgi:hypothetical protein
MKKFHRNDTGANVIIWCYHLMLSSENFTHSLSAQPASLRCLPFGSKLFQGIATMTYSRSHTRPSQKDFGCVVHPLNNKSLGLSQCVQQCTWSPYKFWRSISTFNQCSNPMTESYLIDFMSTVLLDGLLFPAVLARLAAQLQAKLFSSFYLLSHESRKQRCFLVCWCWLYFVFSPGLKD